MSFKCVLSLFIAVLFKNTLYKDVLTNVDLKAKKLISLKFIEFAY